MITTRSIPVVEIFGPTIQGEGPMAGAVSHFVRFGGCDFRCAWCDSSHAVLPEEVRSTKRKNESEILRDVKALPSAPWVTLSGGNPALHEVDWLVNLLQLDGYQVAVETQGTIWKPWLAKVDQLTVSPKPPSSGMATPGSRTLLDQFLAQPGLHDGFGPTPVLKVPVFDLKDYEWAVFLHSQYSQLPFYLSIVTAMGGLHGTFNGGKVDTTDDLLARYRKVVDWVLGDPAMMDNVKVIPQLHVLLWGHERGH